MLDHTISAKDDTRPEWSSEKNNELLQISLTRGSANVLLHLLARVEHSALSRQWDQQNWERFTKSAGEIIGAVWIAKE